MCIYTQKCVCMCVFIFLFTNFKVQKATGSVPSLFLASLHILSHETGHWRPIKLNNLSKMAAGGWKYWEGKDEVGLNGGVLQVGQCDPLCIAYM